MKQPKKSKLDWATILNTIPANNYIFQNIPYKEQIKQAAKLLQEAEWILIGAGAGISTAAGLTL